MKVLYLEALQAIASANQMGGIIEPRNGNQTSIQIDDEDNGDETRNTAVEYITKDIGDVV